MPACHHRHMNEWRRHAACLQAGKTEIFFPEDASSEEATDPALAICNECPVWLDCLAAALAEDERYGIWGGATPLERERMRRLAGVQRSTKLDREQWVSLLTPRLLKSRQRLAAYRGTAQEVAS